MSIFTNFLPLSAQTVHHPGFGAVAHHPVLAAGVLILYAKAEKIIFSSN